MRNALVERKITEYQHHGRCRGVYEKRTIISVQCAIPLLGSKQIFIGSVTSSPASPATLDMRKGPPAHHTSSICMHFFSLPYSVKRPDSNLFPVSVRSQQSCVAVRRRPHVFIGHAVQGSLQSAACNLICQYAAGLMRPEMVTDHLHRMSHPYIHSVTNRSPL